MADFARSAHAGVQAQLDRLQLLSPGGDRLGLDRITRLLERLGRPQDRLPPVLHVAGTNGKGSTCAFLRAGLEAAGHSVHMFTSPHLVRFNERIRIAGTLIEDEALAALLETVIDAGDGIEPSFFEVTTAAAFAAFAAAPADACVIEVGLGGRLDATNVIESPLVCGIAALGIDHQQFLGSDPAGIAREKAAIAKPAAPLLCLEYPDEIAAAVREVVQAQGGQLRRAGEDWHYRADAGSLHYRGARGGLTIPLPALAGAHQVDNCALALAMLRHQQELAVPSAALERMPLEAKWPARLQKLKAGPLVEISGGDDVWIDGGHNPDAAKRVAQWISSRAASPSLIVGLLANKDAPGLLAPLVATGAAMLFVPVPGHDHHAPEELMGIARELGAEHAATAPDLMSAIRQAASGEIAILGSLYLAGEALALNRELPD